MTAPHPTPETAAQKENIMRTCPRCRHDDINDLAHSPRVGVWTLYQCATCLYVWRSTEPARRTDPKHYPPQFALTDEDLHHAVEVPTVPPLLR